MPRMFQNSISSKASSLCLENQRWIAGGFLAEKEHLRNFGTSCKETGTKLLCVVLRKTVRTIRKLKKRTLHKLRLLEKEIEIAEAEKKALSPFGRLVAELPALSVTLSAGIAIFLFFAALAAAERGAWGLFGGEVFAAAAGIGLFYQIVKKLA